MKMCEELYERQRKSLRKRLLFFNLTQFFAKLFAALQIYIPKDYTHCDGKEYYMYSKCICA